MLGSAVLLGSAWANCVDAGAEFARAAEHPPVYHIADYRSLDCAERVECMTEGIASDGSTRYLCLLFIHPRDPANLIGLRMF